MIAIRLQCLLFCVLLGAPLVAHGQDKEIRLLDIRYGTEFNLERYPQKTSEEALRSVVKSIGEGRLDYMLAQLALPAQVDARVKKIAATYSRGSLEDRKVLAFEDLTKITASHFLKDPAALTQLRLLAAKGKWRDEEEKKDDKGEIVSPARRIVYMEDMPAVMAVFHRLENRWFLDNRQR